MTRTATARRRGASSAPADPFAAALAAFDEQRLAALLHRRPDLAEPPPGDLAEVLGRAAATASVYRAVDHLDEVAYFALRAVLASGGAAALAGVAEILGLSSEAEVLHQALVRAEGLLLGVVDSAGTLHAHPSLARVLPDHQLGPPVADLLDHLDVDELRWVARHRPTGVPATRKAELVAALATTLADAGGIRRTVAEAPPAAAALAQRMARYLPRVQSPPFALYPRFATAQTATTDDPLQWLAWHGLVVQDAWYGCAMPREVSMTLRGSQPFGSPRPKRPALVSVAVPDGADERGLVAASTLVAQVDAVVEALDHAPAPLLKSGGLGVRQVRRLAKDTGLPEARTALVVEMAALAGLVGRASTGDQRAEEAMPTVAFDTWSEQDTARRWAMLVEAWTKAESFPSLAGTKGDDGKTVAAFDDVGATSEAVSQRRVVLGLLAELPDGAAAERPSLVAAAGWETPLALPVGPLDAAGHVAWVLDEATTLGLVDHDALSVLGRHVVAGDLDAAVELLAAHSEPRSTGLVLQADLSAIGPVAAPRWFRRRLELMADVESQGATVVYRVGDATVRRAMDAGLSADDILGFLREHAVSGVPQPLEYLVRDVARRHGTIRVGAARSYVRCADEASAVEVLRARRTAKLGLRSIAPTVLVSTQDAPTVVAGLQAAGYLPAHEDADGAVVVTTKPVRRAGAGAVAPASRVSQDAAVAEARRLLAGGAPPASERAGDGRLRRTTGAATSAAPRAGAQDGARAPGSPAANGSLQRGRPPSRAGTAGPEGSVGSGRRGRQTWEASSAAEMLAAAGVPGEMVARASRAGIDEDELAGLLSLLVSGAGDDGSLGFEELLGLAEMFADGPAGDLLAELLDLPGSVGETLSCDCRRPTDIARTADGVVEMLAQAMAHRWTVRLAVSRRRKQPKSFFAEVEEVDTDHGDLVVWSHDQDRDLRLPVASVAWARVLTEAEEHAMFTSDGLR